MAWYSIRVEERESSLLAQASQGWRQSSGSETWTRISGVHVMKQVHAALGEAGRVWSRLIDSERSPTTLWTVELGKR